MRRALIARRAWSSCRPPTSTTLPKSPCMLQSRSASTSKASSTETEYHIEHRSTGSDRGEAGQGTRPSRQPRRQWSSYDMDYEELQDQEARPIGSHIKFDPEFSASGSKRSAGDSGRRPQAKSVKHQYRHGKPLAPRITPTGLKYGAPRTSLVAGTESEPFKTLDVSTATLQLQITEYRLPDVLTALHPQVLHPVAVWPGEYLLKALAFIPTSKSILQLLHIVQRSIPYMEAARVPRLGQRLLGRMGQAHVFTPLPAVIDLLLRTVARAVNDGLTAGEPVPLNDLLKWFIDILLGLQHFRQRPRHGAPKDVFHPLVRTQVVKVTKFFIDLSYRYPSTSETPPIMAILHRRSLNMLVIPGFMSAELSKLLRQHLSDEQLSLSASRYLLRQALADGDHELARNLQDKVQDMLLSGFSLSVKEEQALIELENEDAPLVEPGDDAVAVSEEFDDEDEVAALSHATRQMDQMVFDAKLLDAPNFYESYKRSLQEAGETSGGGIANHVWHRLSVTLYRQAWNREVESTAVDRFFRLIPEDAISSETVSPLISAYVRLGEPRKALELWDELHARERDAIGDCQGRYITPRVIAALTPAFCALYSLEEVVQFIDTWATGRGILDEQTGRTARWFSPDKANLNALLIACKDAGDLRMAYRLFAAARSRWKVMPDDIALALLISTTHNNWRRGRRGGGNASPSRRTTIAHLFFADDGSPVGPHALACYDRRSWTADLDRFWRKEGPRRDTPNPLFVPSHQEEEYALDSWGTAHRLFREVILDNWPILKEVRSPLDLSSGSVTSGLFGHADTETLDPTSVLPGPQARYTSILPESSVFGRYIGFLGYFGLVREIPTVFAWMKALDITPEWRDMRKALMYISEYEGPRRLVSGFEGGTRLMRDEEIMRAWLQTWLGSGTHTWRMLDRTNGQGIQVTTTKVPTDEDVVTLRHNYLKRRERLTMLA